jgi:lipopolysaccharide/colanic/teichoic acid biosynthesis glycosyltransferase
VKYGYASNLDQMMQRLKFDILYIENMSLILDIKILFQHYHPYPDPWPRKGNREG